MRLCTTARVLSIVLMVSVIGALPAAAATRHVVMLFDERAELPGLAALDAEFTRALNSDSTDRIELYREDMDLSRFDSAAYETFLRDTLRTKYAGKKIDAVVAVMGPALDFLLDHGTEIFPGASIVFCGMDKKEFGERSLPSNAHGVLVKREFAPTLDAVLRIHPATKHVVVVAGKSGFDIRLLDQARQEFQVYEDRLAFTYLTSLDLQSLLAELRQLPPRTIVLFTTFFQDGAGQSFVPHDVVELVSATANAPVYGFLDQYLGRGIVGGSLYSFSSHGSEAAKQVLRVLTGTSGPSLVEASANKLQFDWRQMQRWGISEASLPTGSEVRFRDLSLWQQYQTLISAVLAVLMFQAALIAWLIYEHRRRQLAEAASMQRMNELARMNRFATAGELSASIAHELRQPLTAISAAGSAGLLWLQRKRPNLGETREALESVVKESLHAGDVIKSVQAMFRHDATARNTVNLNALVQEVVGVAAGPIHSNNVELETHLTKTRPLVFGDPVQLQQVILNLIMNAVEAMSHTRARRALRLRTEVDHSTGRVSFSVTDSGPPVDPKAVKKMFQPFFTTKKSGMGIGLSICKTIVEAHGGRLTARPNNPHGMEFQITLPLYQHGQTKSLEVVDGA